MKPGDAELTLWLDNGKRHWCLVVSSRRRGKRDSKLWLTPVYDWCVERWGHIEDAGMLGKTRVGTAKTFNEALRLARRTAVLLDRKAR